MKGDATEAFKVFVQEADIPIKLPVGRLCPDQGVNLTNKKF